MSTRASALAVLAILAFPSGSAAADRSDPCGPISKFAEIVMDAHQDGFPMTDMMRLVDEGGPVPELRRRIVIAAYSEPRFRTPANQHDAVGRFRDRVAAECYSADR